MDDIAVNDAAPQLVDLAELVWQLTAELRHEAHLPRCRTSAAPYGRHDPSGTRIGQDCRDAGCLDLVHDILVEVRPRLAQRWSRADIVRPTDALRYANGAIQRAVADIRRVRRVAVGLPAKPGRSDGPAARVVLELARRASDETEARWRVALFRMVRSYACRPSAVRGWPLDAWTAEKTRTDALPREVGSVTSQREIAHDIRLVQAVADHVAGPVWRYQNITEPMMRAGHHGAPLSIAEHEPSTAMTTEEAVLLELFRASYRQLRQLGASPLIAFRRSANDVFGADAGGLDRSVLALAAELDAAGAEQSSIPIAAHSA
jgi:hypothetical protein